MLQGGGALGSYQGGVYEVLRAVHRDPDWVAGVSIGAINAALIAGNPPGKRLERLREFWELVSSPMPVALAQVLDGDLRGAFNEASALRGVLFGVTGFFMPRIPPAGWHPRGTDGAVSHYDTSPLQRTLERLVDFDRINDGPTRLSVGAVNVRTGNFEYFDSTMRRLDARHIMASGALPPGFPPVEIDGESYWDGGLVSNTPLQYVLDQPAERRRVVFQVDLFSALGPVPGTMGEVVAREKDIRFSSRTRLNTTHVLERQRLAQAARRLLDKLPAQLRADPDVQALARLHQRRAGMDIVHLIYRSKGYEGQSKDYEFSRRSMVEHWQAGVADMTRTLGDPSWRNHDPEADGVHVFDVPAADEKPGGPQA
ncbi:MAG: patatin-like phospholipase family protein [Betaproteobacteria bacterium]|nr:patatin-like phospholipase family protein [Betaproteobacteria bacterium]MBU6512931.1 patatin-like phospholipase family protein [Betaproteobacteria bacterium]MDE2153100.1 patatin-like phospholipase family protein [Betaproteobacteria bacterium]MDE2480186.1 patatin-like phospholipase family protein [Betaproteobacteria bacterium]